MKSDLFLDRALSALEQHEDDQQTLQDQPERRDRTYAIKAYRAAQARDLRIAAVAKAKVRYEAAA